MFRFLDKMFDPTKEGKVNLDLLAAALSKEEQASFEILRDKAHGFEESTMEVIADGIAPANDNHESLESGNPTAGFDKIAAQISSMTPHEQEALKQGVIPKHLEE